MTAFVTGATGFVGREVVRQLAVRGTRVVAHVRPDSSALARWTTTFTEQGAEVDTTPWEASALAATLRRVGAQQLYICIGTTKSKAKADGIAGDGDGDIYQRIDRGLTEIAVAAAQQSTLPVRLVYLSSIGADASSRFAYIKARGQAEDAVRGSGLPWVIARPATITGERDESRTGERVAAVVGDGLLAVVGLFGGRGVRATYRSTTGDVLASALIRIGEDPAHDRIVAGAELR